MRISALHLLMNKLNMTSYLNTLTYDCKFSLCPERGLRCKTKFGGGAWMNKLEVAIAKRTRVKYETVHQ